MNIQFLEMRSLFPKVLKKNGTETLFFILFFWIIYIHFAFQEIDMLGMVVAVFRLRRQRKAAFYEFKTSLVCIARSRQERAPSV